jgi:hypothetical protein
MRVHDKISTIDDGDGTKIIYVYNLGINMWLLTLPFTINIKSFKEGGKIYKAHFISSHQVIIS